MPTIFLPFPIIFRSWLRWDIEHGVCPMISRQTLALVVVVVFALKRTWLSLFRLNKHQVYLIGSVALYNRLGLALCSNDTMSDLPAGGGLGFESRQIVLTSMCLPPSRAKEKRAWVGSIRWKKSTSCGNNADRTLLREDWNPRQVPGLGKGRHLYATTAFS